MQAARIASPGVVDVIEVEPPEAGAGGVVVAVDMVGICATDTHIFHGSFPTAKYPLIPGHEATGVIAEVGAGIAHLQPGQRVAIDPGMPCLHCDPCRAGRLNLCLNRRAVGVTDSGAAAQFVRVPAQNCHPIGPNTPARAAVLAEPLACVVHALDLFGQVAGTHALIYGAGTVGLLTASVLRHFGAASVSLVDLDANRLEVADRVADVTAQRAEQLQRASWGLVVDATGATPAIRDGLGHVERGGTFLQIGVAPPDASVPLFPYEVFAKELRILGSMTTLNSFPRAIALLDAGVIPADVITSEPYPLADYATALHNAHRGAAPKVVVTPVG